MKSIGVIPARYGSTRLEGKPLKEIAGKTMIEWVYKRTKHANLDKVVVATDDKRIYDAVFAFGGEAVMTSAHHQTGTDRIAEVAEKYPEFDVVINVQGDEPLIRYEMINSLLEPFNCKEVVMATIKHEIKNPEDIQNPNIVKVITDIEGFGIYFSRSPLPYFRNNTGLKCYRHIGVYGFRRDFLLKYAKMPQTELEKAESLEQLRAIENGYRIKVVDTPYEVKGVDTYEDLASVERYIRENNIVL